jgi:hypothetical protein
MQTDSGQEWQRLTRLYAEKSDEELLDLAADFGNLTEVAQQVLRDEMKRRRIGEPGTKVTAIPDNRPIFGRWNQAIAEQSGALAESEDEAGDEANDLPREYTWRTLLCTCETREEAWQIYEVLRVAGIESWPDRLGSTFGTKTIASQSIRILVGADQLAEARAILARPIPQEIIDQSREKVEDFEAPTCAKCGAADPLLESVEPSNNWLCETCGARWSDSVMVENEGQSPA